MNSNQYKTDYVRCPNCGGYIDQDSMMCRKCGYDAEKDIKNDKTRNAKDRNKAKRPY